MYTAIHRKRGARVSTQDNNSQSQCLTSQEAVHDNQVFFYDVFILNSVVVSSTELRYDNQQQRITSTRLFVVGWAWAV